MTSSSRFESPSFSLEVKSLLGSTRKALWGPLAVVTAAHLSLTRITMLDAQHQAAKPLTTQFVKRQPRLTKPLELRKKPRPRPRAIRRQMVAVRARRGLQEVGLRTHAVPTIRSLAEPKTRVGRSVAVRVSELETDALAQQVQGAMTPQDAIDTSLEMVDVDALDTGHYQAMIIHDPDDKRNIKGYLHLALAYPFSMRHRDYKRGEDVAINGLRRLVAKLNEWTGIKASTADRITFDSAEFLRTPWVYLAVSFSIEPTRGEVERLGQYLLGGGFFFFEGQNFPRYQGERYLMQFVHSALESQKCRQGVDWDYQPLPNSHPIFHCYFDLFGPPAGQIAMLHQRLDDWEPWCRGIEIGGRLVALNTNQMYAMGWGVWGIFNAPYFGRSYADKDPTVQLRFGVNTIIFALTQEGSITHRLMNTVR